MKRLFVLTSVMLFLSATISGYGCHRVTNRKIDNLTRISRDQVGRTEEELRAFLGEPRRVSKGAEGVTELYYLENLNTGQFLAENEKITNFNDFFSATTFFIENGKVVKIQRQKKARP